MPKCKICKKDVDKSIAYILRINDKNQYYCSEQEYIEHQRMLEFKDKTYIQINDIFSRKVINTILFKEINQLAELYGYEKIFNYLEFNNTYLADVMSKDFKHEYAQIRYFTAILKNSLEDFKTEDNAKINIEKTLIVDMPSNNYKPKERKKSLLDFEDEV